MCAGMYALETCLNFLLSHGCYINYISSMSHQSHVELNEAIFYRHINVYQMKSKCVSRENGKWYNRVLMMITVTMTTTRMMIMIKKSNQSSYMSTYASFDNLPYIFSFNTSKVLFCVFDGTCR